MPSDNTLGDTLGNLGRSLSESLNPMRQMQAYQLQQRMFLEQEQLRELQRKNQAEFDAVHRYAQFLPPEFVPQVAVMIHQNAPIDQITKFVAMHSGHLIDKNDPVSLQKNIDFMRQIDPTWTYAKDGPPVGGAVTAKAFDDWKVTQAGAQAGATTAAQKAAENEATNKQNALLAEGYVDDPTPAGTTRNLENYRIKNGKPWDYQTYGPIVIADKTAALHDTWDAQHKGEVAGATETGKNIAANATLPRDLSKAQLYPPPEGFTNTPTGDITLAPPANAPYATPVPVARQTSVGPVFGQSPGEQTAATSIDTATRTQLQEAVDAGVSAKKLTVILDRIQQLNDLAAASPGLGPLSPAIAQKLADMHIYATTKQEIYAEMKSLFKAQVPELRKDMGVRFEAGPELSAQSQMTGAADLPHDVITGIVQRERAIADLGIQRRDLAQRALGQTGEPLAMPDYYTETNKLYDQLPAHNDELLRLHRAIGTPQAPNVSTEPASPSWYTPFVNAFNAITGGGSVQQPPVPQGQPPIEENPPPAVYKGPGQPLILNPPGSQ